MRRKEMADAAIRFEEVYQGVAYDSGRNESTVEIFKAIASKVRELGGRFSRGKALENRMESYRYEVASEVPFHSEHV